MDLRLNNYLPTHLFWFEDDEVGYWNNDASYVGFFILLYAVKYNNTKQFAFQNSDAFTNIKYVFLQFTFQ